MQEPDLTPFERVAVQMQALVPVIRAFEDAFGKDAVREVLEQRVRDDIADARSALGGEGNLAKTAAAFNAFAKGNALQFEVIASEQGTLNVDVTHCRYAQLMEELDATDLGQLLICDTDYAFSLRAGVELDRSQTRMGGAGHCDFRFRLRDA